MIHAGHLQISFVRARWIVVKQRFVGDISRETSVGE